MRRLGGDGCILVGDPGYYTRLGFLHHPALQMDGIPAENLMYLPLADQVPTGEVSHHAAFFATA